MTSISLGRGAKEANLYTEIAEGIHAYGIKGHRHGNPFFPNISSLTFVLPLVKWL